MTDQVSQQTTRMLRPTPTRREPIQQQIHGTLSPEGREVAQTVHRATVVGQIFLALAMVFATTTIALVIASAFFGKALWTSSLISMIATFVFGVFGEAMTREPPRFDYTTTPQRARGWDWNPLNLFAGNPVFQPGQPGVGIYNGGNNCFINSPIQAILHNPEKRQALMESLRDPSAQYLHLMEFGVWIDSAIAPRTHDAPPLLPFDTQKLRSVVYLFATSAFQDLLGTFQAYSLAHQDNLPLAAFLVKVEEIQAAFRNHQARPHISADEIDIIAAICQTIVQDAQLRTAVINAVDAKYSYCWALDTVLRTMQSYHESLQAQRPILPGGNLAWLRGFMPGRDNNGQQDAMAFHQALMDRLDPRDYPDFSFQTRIRKHWVEMPEPQTDQAAAGSIAAAQQRLATARATLTELNLLPPHLRTLTTAEQWVQEVNGFVQNPLAATFVNSSAAILAQYAQTVLDYAESLRPANAQQRGAADFAMRQSYNGTALAVKLVKARVACIGHDQGWIQNRYSLLAENGNRLQRSELQRECGLKLPPFAPGDETAPLDGQMLFDMHFAEAQTEGDEPCVYTKQDGSLALFYPDRQQVQVVGNALPPHLTIRLDRFATNDFNHGMRNNIPVAMPQTLQHGGQTYDLEEIVVHDGGTGGGHYRAYVKTPEGAWWHFDDTHVAPVQNIEERLHVAGYGYFYRLRQPPVEEQGNQSDDTVIVVDDSHLPS